jgi:branched-chain amino acid transport system substrate-binding protein
MKLSRSKHLNLSSALYATLAVILASNQPTFSANNAKGSQDPSTIKIGFETSLSGLVGAEIGGKEMVNGINLYLDQIHHQIGNKKVEILVEDDEANPAVALVKFQKLVEKDKVDVVDGVFMTNVAYSIAKQVDQRKVPFICAMSGADDLTKNQRHHWFLRTGFSASQVSMPFGEYACKVLGYKKVATIGQSFPFSWETIGGFQKTFEEAGGKIVQKVWVPLDAVDLSPYIEKLTKNADAVLVCTTFAPIEKFCPAFRKIKGNMPLIGSGVNFDESELRRIGAPAIGGISAQSYSAALNTPANNAFVAAYKAKYGVGPSWIAECGYTSAMWIAKAIKAVNGNVSDREAFLTALKKVELPDAPRGPIKLDQYGNVIENVYVRKVEKAGTGVQNTVIHTYPHVSQFWKYDPKEYLKQPEYSRDYPPCKNCQE